MGKLAICFFVHVLLYFHLYSHTSFVINTDHKVRVSVGKYVENGILDDAVANWYAKKRRSPLYHRKEKVPERIIDTERLYMKSPKTKEINKQQFWNH
jgi:hypothetical protein